MIKTDYKYSSIDLEQLKTIEQRIFDVVNDFENKRCLGNDFIGWYTYLDDVSGELLDRINRDAQEITDNYDVLVVCGIGGSYLGARAVIEAIKGFIYSGVEIIYLGNTFDERYTADVLRYLENKNFCVNVISKSGGTLETATSFRLLKRMLKEKYGKEYNKRIYAITDQFDGCLRKMADEEGYKTYCIPKDVGGRYSVFTPVGLLPLAAAGVDIGSFVEGAKQARSHVAIKDVGGNVAYQYAGYRYLQYSKGKTVELFASYTPYLNMLSEWWKQLFGESEGKNGKGLFPASVTFSTDLHSLGQFVQEGTKLCFITQLKVLNKGVLKIGVEDNDVDNLNYLKDRTLGEINLIAQEGTNKAHYQIGDVDNFTFVMDVVNEFSVGYMLFVFMYSCMISAGLLGVNAFDQPGVEFYKKEMKSLLKKY